MSDRSFNRQNFAGVVPGPLRINGGSGLGVVPGPLTIDGNKGKGAIQKPLCVQEGKKEEKVDPVFNVFLSTIFGEAGQCSETAWKAVGHVIKNRVGYGEWRKFTTIEAIIKKTGFDAYNDRNYKIAYKYLSNKSVKKIPNIKFDRMIEVLLPVYNGKEADFTSRAIMYYSPKAQKQLHKKKPKIYDEVPFWASSDEYECVNVPGLSTTDDFKFYKYSKERAQFYEKLSKKGHHSRKNKGN